MAKSIIGRRIHIISINKMLTINESNSLRSKLVNCVCINIRSIYRKMLLKKYHGYNNMMNIHRHNILILNKIEKS